MKLRFLGQPIVDFGGWTSDWLTAALESSDVTFLEVATAWLRSSGISPLSRQLRDFSARGGSTSLLVGIDQGGTTRQGLATALDVFQSVRIYHEPGARSFHPKVLLAYGVRQAHVLIGSSNLTAGGLFNNYEASFAAVLDLNEIEDRQVFESVRSWLRQLSSDSDSCKILDKDLLQKLANNPLYEIGDETKKSTRHRAPDYEGVTRDQVGNSIFGPSALARRGLAPSFGPRPSIPAPSQPETQPGQPSVGAWGVRDKTLSANDVGTTGGHQAGPLTPKTWTDFFPSLDEALLNPRVTIDVQLDETGEWTHWEYIHYNGRALGLPGKDEYRLTHATAYLRSVQAEQGDVLQIRRLGPSSYAVRVL